MITYGDALGFCVKHNAVFRVVNRRVRGEFLAANMDIPGDFALEVVVDIYGRSVVAHYPMDSTHEPSKAMTLALIGCVEWFMKQKQQRLVVGGLN